MCKKEVIIIGAGGHSKVIEDIIMASGDTVAGILDDDRELISRLNLLGTTDDYINFQDKYFIIAIGNNATREQLSTKLKNVKFYTAIHPTSVISSSAVISEGSTVMPGCVVNASTSIGKHCIINSNSTVEHDCKINNFSHISPGAVICGTVSIGNNVWIGAGAVVKNNVSICSDVTVGAGGVVVNSITEPGTYIGAPCEKTK